MSDLGRLPESILRMIQRLVPFFGTSDRIPMSDVTVLSVGQCAFDHGAISRLFQNRLQVQVTAAATAQEALRLVASGPFALVLVNRVFDANGDSGLDFIRQLKANAATSGLPAILVSNYADAQAQAVELGALPGFGKAELKSESTLEKLRGVLQPQST